jgi:hypothetical protein
MNPRYIGSLDVGYENLGSTFVQVGTNENPWELVEVSFMKRINLKVLRHERVPYGDCVLHHTNHISDIIDHYVQEYQPWLQLADPLLIEQQPPGGMQNVEALLFKEYRDKAILMSPTAMHHYFHISHLDYEGRKEATTKIALEMLEKSPDQKAKFLKWIAAGQRVHDIADALAYVEMYRRQQEAEWKRQQRCKRPHITLTGQTIDWESFKYRAPKVQKQ